MEKEIKKPDPASAKKIPEELLKSINGGVETGEPAGICPFCSRTLQWLEQGNDNFVRYCRWCLLLFD